MISKSVHPVIKCWCRRIELRHLHQVSQAPLTEDVFEEDHVLFVIRIRPQLRGQQGQRLVQPCAGGGTTWTDGAEQQRTSTTPANMCPLTCSRREHRHGFFHGSAGSARSGRGGGVGIGGGTWTETEDVRALLIQQVAWMNQ